MQAVLESLPSFGPADLAIIHRETLRGGWKTEVWTKRRFAPRELLVACVSSEIRERVWSKNTTVFVGLPEHGAGRHPEGKKVGVDGRHRTVMASAGTLEEHEKAGTLFGVIERSSEPDDCNLSLEQVQWSASCEVRLAGGKKRKFSAEFDSAGLPAIPLLANEKAIPEHTRLVARAETLPAVEPKGKAQKSSGASSSTSRAREA